MELWQLKNGSLFRQECYVNGQWIQAKSGKTFDVTGLSPSASSLQMD
jgi:hypothetical protein